jgi:chemotaxis protein MotC
VTRRASVAASVVLAFLLGASAPARAGSIAAMASDLQALQVKIAAGDKAAYTAQPEQLKAIGAAIAAASPEVWRDKAETDAAVIYLLSGGRTHDIIRLLQSGAVPQSEAPLMRGALDYVVGDEAEAWSLLGGIDPRALDLRLAGQVAYAQSVLAASQDPKKAIGLVDLARLLAPGGLVEEASLRREIALVAEQRDVDRFTMLCRQYVTRFGRSIYADRFLQSVAGTALKAELIQDLPSFQKFHNFVSSLSPDARARFLLTVARAEAVNGKFAVAGIASGEALQEASSDSAEEARARLYEASARILTPEYDKGVAELQTIAVTKLDKHDQALLGAVRGVAAYLREPPTDSPPGNTSQPAAQGGDEAAATIALAESALNRSAVETGASGKGNP